MMTTGEMHLREHRREVDALDLLDLPDECPKCCPECGSKTVRIIWNHKNTNSDFAYCAMCPERKSIGYIQKRFTGATSKPKRRPNLPVTSDWVFERDGWRCQLCGRAAEDGVKLEVCHALSRKEAEEQDATDAEIDDPGNLFAGCFDCNNERGSISLPPLLILRLIRARLRRGGAR